MSTFESVCGLLKWNSLLFHKPSFWQSLICFIRRICSSGVPCFIFWVGWWEIWCFDDTWEFISSTTVHTAHGPHFLSIIHDSCKIFVCLFFLFWWRWIKWAHVALLLLHHQWNHLVMNDEVRVKTRKILLHVEFDGSEIAKI